MKKVVLVLAVLGLGSLASACVTTRAQTPMTRPPLDVPPAPPRVIEPAPPPPLPQPELVSELPPPTTTAPPKPRPQPPARETQKTEPKPAETQPTEPPQATPTQPAPPVPPLSTTRTADRAQTERQIRDIINRANGLLGRVDYRVLTPERRKAYDQAKQFIEGAETAIKDSKLEYALELAEKAETFAKGLQGR